MPTTKPQAKHGCPAYNEIIETLRVQNILLSAYRMKRSADGLNGRTWDEGRHLHAEALIEQLDR